MFRSLPQYDVIKTEQIEDVKSTGTLLRHKKSGARIFLLENEDENKVFDICFRTPPTDSTGVAHILEHSVLCGSKRFPSKDPFVELVKGSLNTFLNAMTYPDKTMYPVASCNQQDFNNLMHVYMDAVFFPNIYEREEIFRQEGWSYVLEKPEDELTYNGVVYNEMKGVFSSPDDVLEREIMNSLFPDTPYGIESGGDPKVIPELKYSEFLDFHRKFYHPSNSYIFLYGDMDMEERLSWLDQEYLSKFDVLEVDSKIPLQKPFEKMKELDVTYSISNTDEERDNTYLAYNLVAGDVLDVKLSAAMAMIEYVLLDAPGAVLKQALLDAGIGKDVEGGYDSGIRQPYFSVIVKNSNPEQKERFLEILNQVLREQVQQGLEEKALLAAINNYEFKFREADYGRYPKGLMYGIDSFDSWLYDENAPFDYLRQLEVCSFLKEQMGSGYFEGLIETYLLDNPHSSLIVMRPQKGQTAQEDERVRRSLAGYKASLNEDEIAELVEKTARLRAFQETPSTKEELEAIPLLRLSDIGTETAPLYNQELRVEDTLLLYHEIDTNGIAYLDLLFDTKEVPEELRSCMGLLKNVLGMVDTEHYGYRDLSNEINIHSGGIYPTLNVYADMKGNGKASGKLEMRAKVLYDQLEFAFGMMEEILFCSKLEDEKRLYEIVAQAKARLQVHLTGSGHTTAATRAMSYFSETSAFNDAVSGIAFYKFIEAAEEQFAEKKQSLIAEMRKLLQLILRKENLMVSVTAEPKALKQIEERIRCFIERLKEWERQSAKDGEPVQDHAADMGNAEACGRNEGFATSSQVQYVAMAGNFRKAGYPYHGALRILRVIMGYEYLWTNVRVRGGAYGCMSGFGRTGDSYFVSYRDPNLEKTLEVYRGIAEYVKKFEVDDRDMCKYIIGTMSELDTPLNPKAKGERSLSAWLGNITQEDLQQERDEILSANWETIRRLAPLMEAIIGANQLCVVGNEEKIAANEELFGEVKPLIGQRK
ncbi:MAG: insulinase family protein [Eubacteriales bacterium]|nr:insulinase family protein [Eubacteriales bacterium]